jgi:hypothetical protein
MNGNGHSDEIAVIFNSDGSTAFNPDLDAWKLFSPVPSIGQLYTQCAPDEPLSVYAMPLSALDTTVDLYAMIGQAGSYTITATEQSPFDAGQRILLEDKSTGNMYNIRGGNTATFSLPAAGPNSPSLFLLHFKKAPVKAPVSVSVCSGSSYTFPDGTSQTNITSDISYTSSFLDINGNDSSVVTNLTVLPVYIKVVSVSVCSGASYTFPDGTVQDTIHSALVHQSVFKNINGCDSIVETDLTVMPSYNQVVSVWICEGSNYTFPDGTVQNFPIGTTQGGTTSSSMQHSTLTSQNGCDSVIVTIVHVNPVFTVAISDSVCSGSSYTFPDGTVQDTIKSALVHQSVFQSAGGCDSIVVTSLSIRLISTQTVAASVCSGSRYDFPDGSAIFSVTSDTTYTSRLQAVSGCDSLVTTVLTVLPVSNTEESVRVCRGSRYTFPDGFSANCRTPQNTASANSSDPGQEKIFFNNFHVSHLKNVFGCDSMISTTLIPMNSTETTPVRDSICYGGSYTFPDGTVQDTIQAAVVHQNMFQNAYGCDSTVLTYLYVWPISTQTVSVSICSGSRYDFPDGSAIYPITSDTVYTSRLQNLKGCDSLITTAITVLPVSNTQVSVKVCRGSRYTFPDGFSAYCRTPQNTASANSSDPVQDKSFFNNFHVSHLKSVLGCDSLISTTLIPENSSETIPVRDSVCAGSNYTFPDGTYKDSINTTIVHTSVFQNVYGCDSSIVTTVTIRMSNTYPVNVTVCSGNSYLFPDGAIADTITVTTIHTSIFQGMNGCDSTILTTVSVNPSFVLFSSASVCSGGSFTFADGITLDSITSTTIHTSKYQSVLGCDSILVTTVSVRPAYLIAQASTVCSGSSYTFPDGSVQDSLSKTIIHTSKFQTAGGCDSLIVTTVTVNPSYFQEIAVAVCSGSGYTFPDGAKLGNITAGLSYYSKFISITGCDSIIETILKVNALPLVSVISTSSTVCAGSTVTLSGQGASSYVWSDGVQDGVAFTPAATTRYYLKAQDANQCSDTASIVITVNHVPVVCFAKLGFNDTLCESEGPQHLGSATPVGGTYFGDGVSGLIFSPAVAGVGTHILTYLYSDANACVSKAQHVVDVTNAIITGIHQEQLTNQVVLYPNPSHGLIVVESASVLNQMSIFSLGGELVYQLKSENVKESIDLSFLGQGVYLLEVHGKHFRIVRD